MKKFFVIVAFGVVAGLAFAALFLYMEFHNDTDELTPYKPVRDPAPAVSDKSG